MSPDEDDKPSGATLSYLGALGWTFAATGAAQLVATVANELRPGGGLDTVALSVTFLVATLGVVLGMARVHGPDEDLGALLGAKSAAPILTVLAFVAGVSLVFATSGVDATLADKMPLGEEEKALFATDTARQRALLALLLVVVPVTHEVFFRGALFTLLERDKPRQMVVFVTTVLAVFPPDRYQLVSGFVLAAVAGHLRGLSRSLWPALALRLGFAGVLVVAVLTRHDELKVPKLTQGLAAVAAAICIAVFVVVARGITRRRVGP